ncbi:MAG: sigma 54-interacting transcriptional regulator [Clostridiales Family XIII bacterium]|jgi:transcriptional regulator of acetoin/glycerol metabolism|nr:sigma 54-interacting transcriptional regulator [Clostridiales Family XIII bacterium]
MDKKTYRDKDCGIARLWETYVAGDAPFPKKTPPGIKPFIFHSWKRSKEFGVSPFEVSDQLLSPERLEAALKENKTLISLTHPYFTKLFAMLEGSDFLIALSDREGNVVDLVGLFGEIGQHAEKSSLTIGCNRSERTSGTCGIGTCIATGKPIQIIGEEHFIQPHHRYVCYAAPIKSKLGDLLGVIAVIGPSAAMTPHTFAMVCVAADGIEKEFRMLEINNEISLINKKLSTTIQSLSQGLLMIDNNGVITQANKSANDMLKLRESSIKESSITGVNIRNLLRMETATLDIMSLTQNVTHRELNVTNNMGIALNLSISASVLNDEHGNRISIILMMEERKTFTKIASKVGGFVAHCDFDRILGVSDLIQDIKRLGELAAHSESNVLILGESGTGKDIFAQSIHNASPRAKFPFVAINCGSLPRSLVESELFGYEPGAFTGANKDGCPGKFELADGGTIFLDEIGDIPLDIQVLLLRVIQTREILRIGGKAPKHVDVRIIAATNVNLAEHIENRSFRKDLYYRLNVLSFHMPALRQRKEDIPVLVEHFIQEHNRKMDLRVRGFTPAAMNYIMEYDWPGNIRELENIVERAMNMARDSVLTERELGQEVISNRFFN